ncbi:molybdopterin-binding protein [Leifsonia sp. fls2-241-R2A-40a]|uniref:molybdopterin molybdotransferase MoeA n=1 Tax=Leifsonia sp. fls2-241-R2A-40a TaxID=3040290 RepID=UPI0025519365|nr:molybdopterin-binding protein [Leifsonia sp. fls2-241-R2A-40a]
MTSWREARGLAEQVGRGSPTRVLTVPVARAAALAVAAEVRSARSLPPFDNSAMDGWAVAGDGPWRVGEPVLAGSIPPVLPLVPGEARPVATGAPVPPGTLTVLRSEDAAPGLGGDGGLVDVVTPPCPGRDIRRSGEEAEPGDVLLTAGAVLSPPALGLLAAAGVEKVDIASPPLVTFVAIGDELAGVAPGPGQLTDSLSPMMPSLFAALGGRCATTARALDRPADVAAAIRRARTATVITSGGTAHGPADPLRDALDRLGARILLDGMDLRPGGSLLLAELGDGRHVLSLPGNPLAAVVALIVVGWPLLQGRLGRSAPAPTACALPPRLDVDDRQRAVACILEDGMLAPVAHQRSGMLRGVSIATHLVLTGGGRAEQLRLPWS